MKNKLILSLFFCICLVASQAQAQVSIVGTLNVCIGMTTALSSSDHVAGTWTSSASTKATVNSSTGIVTGVSSGTARISYTRSGGVSATAVVTINPTPSIIGYSTVCSNATITLTGNMTGGTWSSSATSTATVTGADNIGTVSGVSAGTANITYTLATGCYAIQTVTVLVAPGPITGPSSLCVGITQTYTDGTTGGTWSKSNGNVTISGPGLIAGSNPGTSAITYKLSNGCYSTFPVTVNTSSPISGGGIVCQGLSITLSDATSGGTWSSSSTNAAVGMSTGIVTGLTPGTSTISYILPSGCIALTTVTVDPLAPITGPTIVCEGGTITLSDAVSGGVWNSDIDVASVNPSTGVVTGINATNYSVIDYTLSSGCTATYVITVGALIPDAGTISGTPSLCVGATTTLLDPAPGGIWSSSATGVATVGAGTGIVTGVHAGTATISYTVTTSCGSSYVTAIVTVNPLPDAGTISGTLSVCYGATTTLIDGGTAGGTWSSGATGVATVSLSRGIVTGVSTGTATISYTVTNGCGTAYSTAIVTVNPLPDASTISGTLSVCVGATTTLIDGGAAGGTWSSGATGVANVGLSTGIVTGVSAGTAAISYTITGSCGTAFATATVTVNASPDFITGVAAICFGSTITLSDDITGGTWSSSNTPVATVDITSGVVTGVAAGTATITYILSDGCYATVTVSVNGVSNPVECGEIYDSPVYDFGFNNVPNVSGITVNYTADIAVLGTYTVTNAPANPLTLLTGSAYYFTQITISDVPDGSTSYGYSYPTGWSVIGYNLLSVNYDGCTWTDGCHEGARHTSGASTGVKQIAGQMDVFSVIPNPNNGTFNITGGFAGSIASKEVKIEVVDMLGKTVFSDKVTVINGEINKSITLGDDIANGVYLVRVKNETTSKVLRFMLER